MESSGIANEGKRSIEQLLKELPNELTTNPESFLALMKEFDEVVSSKEAIEYLKKNKQAMEKAREINTKFIDGIAFSMTAMATESLKMANNQINIAKQDSEKKVASEKAEIDKLNSVIVDIKKGKIKLTEDAKRNTISENEKKITAIKKNQVKTYVKQIETGLENSGDLLNKQSYYVYNSIVGKSDNRNKSREECDMMIERWIQIAYRLHQGGNFFSAQAVMAGLGKVEKLFTNKQDKSLFVSPDAKEKYNKLLPIYQDVNAVQALLMTANKSQSGPKLPVTSIIKSWFNPDKLEQSTIKDINNNLLSKYKKLYKPGVVDTDSVVSSVRNGVDSIFDATPGGKPGDNSATNLDTTLYQQTTSYLAFGKSYAEKSSVIQELPTLSIPAGKSKPFMKEEKITPAPSRTPQKTTHVLGKLVPLTPTKQYATSPVTELLSIQKDFHENMKQLTGIFYAQNGQLKNINEIHFSDGKTMPQQTFDFYKTALQPFIKLSQLPNPFPDTLKSDDQASALKNILSIINEDNGAFDNYLKAMGDCINQYHQFATSHKQDLSLTPAGTHNDMNERLITPAQHLMRIVLPLNEIPQEILKNEGISAGIELAQKKIRTLELYNEIPYSLDKVTDNNLKNILTGEFKRIINSNKSKVSNYDELIMLRDVIKGDKQAISNYLVKNPDFALPANFRTDHLEKQEIPPQQNISTPTPQPLKSEQPIASKPTQAAEGEKKTVRWTETNKVKTIIPDTTQLGTEHNVSMKPAKPAEPASANVTTPKVHQQTFTLPSLQRPSTLINSNNAPAKAQAPLPRPLAEKQVRPSMKSTRDLYRSMNIDIKHDLPPAVNKPKNENNLLLYKIKLFTTNNTKAKSIYKEIINYNKSIKEIHGKDYKKRDTGYISLKKAVGLLEDKNLLKNEPGTKTFLNKLKKIREKERPHLKALKEIWNMRFEVPQDKKADNIEVSKIMNELKSALEACDKRNKFPGVKAWLKKHGGTKSFLKEARKILEGLNANQPGTMIEVTKHISHQIDKIQSGIDSKKPRQETSPSQPSKDAERHYAGRSTKRH